MYKLFDELSNYMGSYKTLRGAKNAYDKKRSKRDGFCHPAITNDDTGEKYYLMWSVWWGC